MLKVEKIFSGSVNSNFMEDDLTFKNYLALYCCIKGVKLGNEKRVIVSSDKAFSALKIKKRVEAKSKKVKLINVETGEAKVMSEDKASDFLRIKKSLFIKYLEGIHQLEADG
ncbi:hypothetical protein Q3304_18810 [Clostridioides sp. GD02377]|uniref:hypothetical protein n=1 Tax=unclassified Clostridioides TaxID=2635829 RepID=UPI0038AF35A8